MRNALAMVVLCSVRQVEPGHIKPRSRKSREQFP
jgi:hypothetical protein